MMYTYTYTCNTHVKDGSTREQLLQLPEKQLTWNSIYLGAVWPFLIIYQPATILHVLLKYAIGHFQMLVRPYHSDILDISRLYNLHQLTPKLMNSKWGPIKDCGWHFCAPFAGDFSSHPVLVMWPNGVNPAFANKKVLRLWKCWWTISYRYHSLSYLSFTHQAFTRISREIHPVDF